MTHVVLSGLPGVGKSRIAGPLARALGAGLIAKDTLKEALWDVLGPGDVDWSRLLGRAANEVVVSVARHSPPVVLDSFWRHEWAREVLEGLGQEVIEVFCACPTALAHERYSGRVRHAAHMDAPRTADPDLWRDDRNAPLFPAAVVVDTTVDVDVDALAERVRHDRRWADGVGSQPFVAVVSGLPATGKSALVGAVAAATGATPIAHDIVQAALLRTGTGPESKSVGAGYKLMTALARDQLGVGHAAVLDSVAGRSAAREEWRALSREFDVPMVVIECVCTDVDLHRRRLATRRRDIEGWDEPTWDEVEAIRARFEPWDDERLVVDAVEPMASNVDLVVEHVTAAVSPP